ncbi:hypothetical protein DID77_04635 [Candidatus Marinamargulisbacteria bacterium SCGC AG-439-L15]|nr:hypothetical protein DID77_04635 [Candidatus Marinamargulisbacteria bacterium SCGC AG-439-L15]
MAPRGIVTASIASLFALQLVADGVSGAEALVPLSFLVIIVTVSLYGLTAEYLQRWLGLSRESQLGLLFVGAGMFNRRLARVLNNLSINVKLVDSNKSDVIQARLDGLNALHANIFSDKILEELEMGGISQVLSMTSREEVNSLTVLQYSDVLGKEEVFRLAPDTSDSDQVELRNKIDKGKYLFKKGCSFGYLRTRIETGSVIKVLELDTDMAINEFRNTYGERSIPLFRLSKEDKFNICETSKEVEFFVGDRVVALV